MPLVTQDAHDLGRERFVEDIDDALTVGAVRGGDRALLDVLACSLAQRGYIGEKVGR